MILHPALKIHTLYTLDDRNFPFMPQFFFFYIFISITPVLHGSAANTNSFNPRSPDLFSPET